MMARPNMPKKIRVKCYVKLQKKWPEICSHCQKTLTELHLPDFDPISGTGGMPIHHTRYDVAMDDTEYQRFMCHGCNHLKEFSYAELEKYHNELSSSMHKNLDTHQIFQEWFAHEMSEEKNNYKMSYADVVDSGSYVSGANVSTVERWVRPLVSKAGPFSRSSIDGVDSIYLKGKDFSRPAPKTTEDFNKAVEKHKNKDALGSEDGPR